MERGVKNVGQPTQKTILIIENGNVFVVNVEQATSVLGAVVAANKHVSQETRGGGGCYEAA